MSANLLYVTKNAARFEALNAICADENYTLAMATPKSADDCAAYDLVFCDAENDMGLTEVSSTAPVVSIYDSSNSAEADAAVQSQAIDVLSYPFGTVETAARLRCLSRLHMLQTELSGRNTIASQRKEQVSVLVIGAEAACNEVSAALSPVFTVDCAPDDMTGLLRAAQGQWACVVVALSEESREPAPLIRQLRVLDRTRTTPVLAYSASADARCIAALQAGANDMALASCQPAELAKRIEALALRKAVLDALRSNASAITPLTDFDHVTGLPGPTQLQRSMQVSLDRLKAQGKPASLLLIAIDPAHGMPEGEAVPDNVMQSLTQVLRRSLRGFDFACRFGADCFAVFMPGADAKGAEIVATRICAEIKSEKVRLKDNRKDGTTASIGLAAMVASGGSASADQIIATASDSLAKAQAQGAARIVAQEIMLAA